MAKKNVVVEKTVEVKAEEQKSVEMIAPATPAKNAKTAPQPATDKPKTETKKSTKKSAPKKSAPKDKSEKDEIATNKPAENAQKPKFKVSKRDKEMAEKRALLKAAGLSEAAIEAAIAAQFGTKADKSKSDKSDASTEMFPETFSVHGVKFTKCALKATENEDGDESYVKSLLKEFFNAQQNGTVIAIALHTPREFTAQKGKSQTSEYERWYGVICPEQLPFDLEMLSIDAILTFHFEGVLMHSMYTEVPSTLTFKTFQKRDKNGAFTALNNFKFEVYTVDFTNKDDNVHGDYIDLFDNK